MDLSVYWWGRFFNSWLTSTKLFVWRNIWPDGLLLKEHWFLVFFLANQTKEQSLSRKNLIDFVFARSCDLYRPLFASLVTEFPHYRGRQQPDISGRDVLRESLARMSVRTRWQQYAVLIKQATVHCVAGIDVLGDRVQHEIARHNDFGVTGRQTLLAS